MSVYLCEVHVVFSQAGEEQEEEEEDDISPSESAAAKPHLLIRRKSGLPLDFETAKALQQYHTVEATLSSSQEGSS